MFLFILFFLQFTLSEETKNEEKVVELEIDPDIQPSFSGSCGDNCTWDYDNDHSILKISGEGNMTDYKMLDSPFYFGQNDTLFVGWRLFQQFAEELIIEEGIKTIGHEAFVGMKSLKKVHIPSSVISIGNYSFQWCEKLETIEIPDTVLYIGKGLFMGCLSLKNVTVGKNVQFIGQEAFHNCSSLENIIIHKDNEKYTSKDGVFFNKNMSKLIQYPNANERTTYEIPNTVVLIDGFSFDKSNRLETLIIPESVKFINIGAFFNCNKLVTVNYYGTTEPECYGNVFSWCRGSPGFTCPLKTVNVLDSYPSQNFCEKPTTIKLTENKQEL